MNRIGWCDRTLNPCAGCSRNCPYCYARPQLKRQRKRCRLCYEFVPHEHLERLSQLSPRQRPKRIFIDSVWDWNDPKVEEWWLSAIWHTMRDCPQHTFQILSKNPSGYSRFVFPRNVWLGASITSMADAHRIGELLKACGNNLAFLSAEPLHGPITARLKGLGWLIVGAETGHRKGKITPKPEWVEQLIAAARKERIPVYLKDNLNWPVEVKEFPEAAKP